MRQCPLCCVFTATYSFLNGTMQPEGGPAWVERSSVCDHWQTKRKKRAEVKTKCLHCTREGSPSHIPAQTLCQSGPDSLFQFSLRRRVVYPPSHLRCLRYDQTGSAVVSVCQHRLTFLPHEVSICCTWQAAGSAQFARLVKPDTDKKRLGEKLTHRGKSTAPANIWWCDFR